MRPLTKGDGSTPGGDPRWLEKKIAEEKEGGADEHKGPFDRWLVPKFSDIQRGSRMTDDRLSKMDISDRLTPMERKLLIEMLYNREKALAWEVGEKGMVSNEIKPPQVVHTIDHNAWAEPAFRVPRKLVEIEQEHVKDKLRIGLIEPCWGPYRNASFFELKKTGKYRFVISCIRANAVTMRDAGLPPNVEEFAEGFAGYPAVSIIDFFMGYEQIALHPQS